MIELVLYDAGGETLRRPFEPVSVAVQTVNPKFSPARGASSQLGNAQTTFPIFQQFFIEHRYLGINKDRQRDIAARPAAFNDGHGKRVVNLRSGQSHAAV